MPCSAVMGGCLSHQSVRVKVSKSQRDKVKFLNTSKFVDTAQLSQMLTLSKA